MYNKNLKKSEFLLKFFLWSVLSMLSTVLAVFVLSKLWSNSLVDICKIICSFTFTTYHCNLYNSSFLFSGHNTLKQTKQQSKLTREQRLVNLKDSFKINKKYLNQIKDKKIIIVDDVISTWTTINEVSKILKESWASKIIWLIIASD